MAISPSFKLFDIILKNHLLILPIEHFGATLAVGEKSVADFCIDNSVNIDLFVAIANLFDGVEYEPKGDFSFSDLKAIIRYLKNCHRYYLEEKCPQIYEFIRQESEINSSSEMALVKNFFDEYISEVTKHLDYENNIVFPYVEQTFARLESGKLASTGIYSVAEYQDHHDDIEEKLTDLKNLLIKYLPINQDQVLRRKLLFALFEFEFDLNIHSKIEDSILIPLVVKLENAIKS